MPAFIIVVIAMSVAISSNVKLPRRSWLPLLWTTSGRMIGNAPRAAVLWFWPMADLAMLGLVWFSNLSAVAVFAVTVLLGSLMVLLQSAHVFFIRREVSF